MNSSFNLEYLIFRKDIDPVQQKNLISKISGKTRVEVLSDSTFTKLAETENSQGIIGVASKPAEKTKTPRGNIVIALDRINDPGNLGTIIRTAYWFNVKTIYLSAGSADACNSKVIRASQGAVFHTDVQENINITEKLHELSSVGFEVFLFTLDGTKYLNQISTGLEKKSVLVFGSESQGISKEILDLGFEQVTIKGFSGCESLNVAISFGIALYELNRRNS